MRGVEPARDLSGEIQQVVYFERAAFDATLQSLALEEFHHQEWLAFKLIDIINRANVWMVQRGGHSSFSPKPRQRVGITNESRGKKLQGDKPAQLGVFRFVHDAHPAATDPFDDPIVRNRFADHGDFPKYSRVTFRRNQLDQELWVKSLSSKPLP